ncbi:MAG: type I-D CRISPR-associated helicase Cas3' [Caldilineaceae bacterium]|nr:type I-D CRISPR-associated helicase Cas3' [Caldilineaceae bacterium]
MVEIHLTGQSEKVAVENPYNLSRPPLYHQLRTADALQSVPLVMNAYNTGTGKTYASLLHLFSMKGTPKDNVLFIAPTNELIHQHYEDICEFVEANNLRFRPIEINAAVLKSWHSDDRVDRSGERFVDLIRSNGQTFHAELGIAPDDHDKLPLILVTNPDLFYYALFWQFSPFDQRNLFQTFVTSFRYIVIDEFHYYNSKQLANFLLFMALSKEWGFFAEGRRFCLLSATPDAGTRMYLDRLFGPDDWVLISPENEPPEVANLPTTPVLAPAILRLVDGTIDSYAKEEGKALQERLGKGEDGALIANALWRINQAHAALRFSIGAESLGRITGAQPVAQRRADQFKPLILATPTVDIGYNFKKKAKARQNLDFVVFEARFQDELIQRMGRAGRVLGKTETEILSEAIGLVSPESIAALQVANGQTFSRSEFLALLTQTVALPEKADFQAYVSRGGLEENIFPLYNAQKMLSTEDSQRLEAAFEVIRGVFAPTSRRTFAGIHIRWKQQETIDGWLRESTNSYHIKHLPEIIATYLEWLTGEKPEKEDIRAKLSLLLKPPYVDGFRLYCEMERARTQTQFSFRDSFSGPTAWVYDPERLLSGAEVTQYDLIHLVENYQFTILDEKQFLRATGGAAPAESICIGLQRHRQERLRVSLRWRPPRLLHNGWSEAAFIRCYAAGQPIAVNGLLIRAQEPLDAQIRDAIGQQYVLALLVPERLNGTLQSQLRYRAIYSRKLLVGLTDGEKEFEVVLGSSALLLEPLMAWAFQQAQDSDEAIIC